MSLAKMYAGQVMVTRFDRFGLLLMAECFEIKCPCFQQRDTPNRLPIG